MPTINLQGFAGSNNAMHPRLLNEAVGVNALDMSPGYGELRPISARLTVATVPASPQRKTIVGMGRDGSGYPAYWLGWDKVVSVTSGFDGNDSTDRIYFSGDGTPKWTNNIIGLAGGAPYPQGTRELAVPAPTTPCLVAIDTDGTGTEADRFYVHTFVNDLGWESAPSPLSAALTCKDGATVDITSLPAAPAGTGAPNANPIASGGGGGAGQRVIYTFEDVTEGEELTIGIPAGGGGGAPSQVNSGGAVAGSGGTSSPTTVLRGGVSYAAAPGVGGSGGRRDSNAAHEAGFSVSGGSLGGAAGYGRNRDTGAYIWMDFLYQTPNGAVGGYGGSSQYGAGGAGGGFAYRVAANGAPGGRGAGGGGGAAECQHPDVAYTGSGAPGGSGYVLLEFYDPFSVVPEPEGAQAPQRPGRRRPVSRSEPSVTT